MYPTKHVKMNLLLATIGWSATGMNNLNSDSLSAKSHPKILISCCLLQMDAHNNLGETFLERDSNMDSDYVRNDERYSRSERMSSLERDSFFKWRIDDHASVNSEGWNPRRDGSSEQDTHTAANPPISPYNATRMRNLCGKLCKEVSKGASSCTTKVSESATSCKDRAGSCLSDSYDNVSEKAATCKERAGSCLSTTYEKASDKAETLKTRVGACLSSSRESASSRLACIKTMFRSWPSGTYERFSKFIEAVTYNMVTGASTFAFVIAITMLFLRGIDDDNDFDLGNFDISAVTFGLLAAIGGLVPFITDIPLAESGIGFSGILNNSMAVASLTSGIVLSGLEIAPSWVAVLLNVFAGLQLVNGHNVYNRTNDEESRTASVPYAVTYYFFSWAYVAIMVVLHGLNLLDLDNIDNTVSATLVGISGLVPYARVATSDAFQSVATSSLIGVSSFVLGNALIFAPCPNPSGRLVGGYLFTVWGCVELCRAMHFHISAATKPSKKEEGTAETNNNKEYTYASSVAGLASVWVYYMVMSTLHAVGAGHLDNSIAQGHVIASGIMTLLPSLRQFALSRSEENLNVSSMFHGFIALSTYIFGITMVGLDYISPWYGLCHLLFSAGHVMIPNKNSKRMGEALTGVYLMSFVYIIIKTMLKGFGYDHLQGEHFISTICLTGVAGLVSYFGSILKAPESCTNSFTGLATGMFSLVFGFVVLCNHLDINRWAGLAFVVWGIISINAAILKFDHVRSNQETMQGRTTVAVLFCWVAVMVSMCIKSAGVTAGGDLNNLDVSLATVSVYGAIETLVLWSQRFGVRNPDLDGSAIAIVNRFIGVGTYVFSIAAVASEGVNMWIVLPLWFFATIQTLQNFIRSERFTMVYFCSWLYLVTIVLTEGNTETNFEPAALKTTPTLIGVLGLAAWIKSLMQAEGTYQAMMMHSSGLFSFFLGCVLSGDVLNLNPWIGFPFILWGIVNNWIPLSPQMKAGIIEAVSQPFIAFHKFSLPGKGLRIYMVSWFCLVLLVIFQGAGVSDYPFDGFIAGTVITGVTAFVSWFVAFVPVFRLNTFDFYRGLYVDQDYKEMSDDAERSPGFTGVASPFSFQFGGPRKLQKKGGERKPFAPQFVLLCGSFTGFLNVILGIVLTVGALDMNPFSGLPFIFFGFLTIYSTNMGSISYSSATSIVWLNWMYCILMVFLQGYGVLENHAAVDVSMLPFFLSVVGHSWHSSNGGWVHDDFSSSGNHRNMDQYIAFLRMKKFGHRNMLPLLGGLSYIGTIVAVYEQCMEPWMAIFAWFASTMMLMNKMPDTNIESHYPFIYFVSWLYVVVMMFADLDHQSGGVVVSDIVIGIVAAVFGAAMWSDYENGQQAVGLLAVTSIASVAVGITIFAGAAQVPWEAGFAFMMPLYAIFMGIFVSWLESIEPAQRTTERSRIYATRDGRRPEDSSCECECPSCDCGDGDRVCGCFLILALVTAIALAGILAPS